MTLVGGKIPEHPFSTNDFLKGSPLFRIDTSIDEQNHPELPSLEARNLLLRTYKEQVDPLFKATFWPATSRAIEKQHKNGYHGESSPSLQALEVAVYYLSACSTDAESVQADAMSDKHQLVSSLRRAVEMLFNKAKLLQQPDLTLLQAFVIYLVSCPVSSCHLLCQRCLS